MKILPDETAGSFAFRLAQSRQQSVAALCEELFDLCIAKNPTDLDRRLARDFGPALVNAAHARCRATTPFQLGDQFVHSVWNRTTRKYTGLIRVCPYCLHEAKYGRRFWRSRLAAACPRHGIELIGACPHCHAPQTFFDDTGGFGLQYWLESWPMCPACLRTIDRAEPAHSVLIMISRRWASAMTGQPQKGYSARDFLRLSARLLARFDTDDRYREFSNLAARNSNWPYHLATAFLLRSLLAKYTPENVAYAALGIDFQPGQLAREIVV